MQKPTRIVINYAGETNPWNGSKRGSPLYNEMPRKFEKYYEGEENHFEVFDDEASDVSVDSDESEVEDAKNSDASETSDEDLETGPPSTLVPEVPDFEMKGNTNPSQNKRKPKGKSLISSKSSKVPKIKQISPAVHWIFTWNNYKASDILELLQMLKKHKYVFQEETGDEGTPHLQGYVHFCTKVRPKSEIPVPEIHWEKCKRIKSSIDYCSKFKTRTGKCYTNMEGVEPLVDPMVGKTYRKWQIDLERILSEPPDDRTIYWIYEPKGGAGKTTWMKSMCIRHNALVLEGKPADIKCGIQKWKERGRPTRLLFFSFVRDTNWKRFKFPAMEASKDGIFFSGKYESDMALYNNPHVVCFANVPPRREGLSLDRWKIYEIINEELVQDSDLL